MRGCFPGQRTRDTRWDDEKEKITYVMMDSEVCERLRRRVAVRTDDGHSHSALHAHAGNSPLSLLSLTPPGPLRFGRTRDKV